MTETERRLTSLPDGCVHVSALDALVAGDPPSWEDAITTPATDPRWPKDILKKRVRREVDPARGMTPETKI